MQLQGRWKVLEFQYQNLVETLQTIKAHLTPCKTYQNSLQLNYQKTPHHPKITCQQLMPLTVIITSTINMYLNCSLKWKYVLSYKQTANSVVILMRLLV